MKLCIIFSFSTLQLLLFSCNEERGKINYYENGNVKEMHSIYRNDTVIYEFYDNGLLKHIKKFRKEGLQGEQLWFFDNGKLDRKIFFAKNLPNGHAYYFYDSNGAIKNFRYFRNGVEVLYGIDYWGDSLDLMKASLHFNDSGHLFYKKNFDRNGKLIDDEGKRN